MSSRAYSDRELLELFEMLLRSQIREERINSIEELYGLLRHVTEALAEPEALEQASLAYAAKAKKEQAA